jgi:hypothetical protein
LEVAENEADDLDAHVVNRDMLGNGCIPDSRRKSSKNTRPCLRGRNLRSSEEITALDRCSLRNFAQFISEMLARMDDGDRRHAADLDLHAINMSCTSRVNSDRARTSGCG